MCGIFAALARGRPLSAGYDRSLGLIAHRGPDGSGVERISVSDGAGGALADAAWLGHRRLSIIDTSDRGLQPMASADGRWWLIFNGEIYNYLELRAECRAAGIAFRTETDTEVLLAAWSLWGKRALQRFIGMFAFVLVDRQDGVAWLARDHFGIKPLHYAVLPDKVLVSSEIPPLLATGEVPFEIDQTRAFEFLRFGGSTEETQTIVSGIRRLGAGTVACLDLNGGAFRLIERFWQPSVSERRLSFADAVQECRERFLANIRLHLRSDVPVGAALSGGIDSSAVVAAVKLVEPDLRLNTFSFISDEPGQSEERWIDIVNDAVDAIPHKIRPAPQDLASDFVTMVRRQGEPFASASIYAQYRVFAAARAAGVPVTLDGQGADELLGGYWPFVGTLGASLLKRGRLGALAALLRGRDIPDQSRKMVAANTVQAALPPGLQIAFRAAIGREVLPDWFDKGWMAENGIDWKGAARAAIGPRASLREHLADATARSSLPNLLRLADRSSMAFSVESRVPFLTPDFADFLLSLPDAHLISPSGARKHVFLEAMRGILPEEIRTRRDKIGFFADDATWLRANWPMLRPWLDGLRDMPLFDHAALGRFVAAFEQGRPVSPQLIWRVVTFAIWRAEMQALVP